MSELIMEVMNGEPSQYYPLGEYVMCAVGVCSSRPTFKYTRIEIAGALDRIAAGESLRGCLKTCQTSQATDHEMDHRHMNHGFTRLG